MANLEPLVVDDLRIVAERTDSPSQIRCTWSGKSTHRHPSKVLGPWFDKLLAWAEGESAPVSMHFEGLEHFNSSTIGAIVQLIQSARSRGVRLTLCYSATHRWQRLSFEALRVFVEDDGLFQLEAV